MFNYINKFTYLLVLVLPLLQRIKGIVVRLKRIRVILMYLKPHKISIFLYIKFNYLTSYFNTFDIIFNECISLDNLTLLLTFNDENFV